MRIAFYAPLKAPTHDTPSGDRRVARLLLDALRLAGHDVELASDFRSYEGAGDPLRQAALRDEGGKIAGALVDRWCNGPAQRRPELWFTYHLYYKAPDWLGPVVSGKLGIPYVVSEASHAPKRADGAWAIGHAATGWALRAAAMFLCPTGEDIACLREVARTDARIVRLPPFLDPAPYLAAAQSRAAYRESVASANNLSPTQPWIVVAAMMRRGDKLASYRMLALALQCLTDLAWQVVVAGDGPTRAEVHALMEDAAPGRCRFLGECSPEAMAAIYAACDLCVWPAVNEAYGMALLEAQASGVPVVACSVRGVPDVVCDGRTGLLAAPGDVLGLAGLARVLLLDPQRRRAMGQAAADFVRCERSTAQAATLLNGAFEGLAHSGQARLDGPVPA